jgi:tetratricopeptide (TPR) repeat protein
MEKLAAYFFGVVFVVVILTFAVFFAQPTEFQIFVFRIVLALAAAGIGAVIPGFISVNVGPYVKAGGAIALFVIIYFLNPPALVKGSPKYDDLIRRGEAAIAAQNSADALELFSQAQKLEPEKWVAYNGLGRVNFSNGNYAAALENLKIAFEKGDKRDGAQLIGIGLAQDGLRRYDAARDSYSSALSLLSSDSFLANDARFSRGLMSLLLWLQGGAPKQSAQWSASEQDFNSYLENQRGPKHWAHYHLACLYGTNSQDVNLTPEARGVQAQKAVAFLRQSVEGLAQFPSEKAPVQKSMMKTLINEPDSYQRQPSYPARCPALRDVWMQSGASVESLLVRL